MSIRRRLLLSYLGFITLFVVGVILAFDLFGIDCISRAVLQASTESLDRLTAANAATARRMLTANGEELVAAHARAAALDVALALADRDDLEDYERLRGDQALRHVAIQDLNIGGRVVGYTSLLDLKGNAVIHPNRELVERLGYLPYRELYPDMWRLVERSFHEPEVRGYYRFLDKETSRERDKYLVIVRVPGTPFTLDAVVFRDDFFQAMADEVGAAGEGEKTVAHQQLEAAVAAAGDAVKLLWLGLSACLLLAAAAVAHRFAAALSLPITRLRDAVATLGRGDFATRVPEAGSDEIRDLARTFNRLGGELTGYIEHLRAETAAREAMVSEIRLAGEVQRALLPPAEAPWLSGPDFRLHAALRPARECAGDFYDYFPAGGGTLAIALGDVSGKGLPAAIHMAMTLILLRSHGAGQRDPGRVLALVNEAFSWDGADSGAFVTLFLAYYQPATGRLVYANAGHHAALLIRRGGEMIPFGLLHDPAIGFGPVSVFHKGEVRLAPGERLFLYTDGATEAQGRDGILFGEARLRGLLGEWSGLEGAEMLSALMEALLGYQDGISYDDITLILLERGTLSLHTPLMPGLA